MNADDIRRLFPRASASLLAANAAEPHDRRPLSHPVAERHQTPALDKTTTGETPRAERPLVRFTGHRVRPLDPDNFAGSVKDLLDGLRHAGIIPGDEPWRIRLETAQEKVATFAEERTEITVTYE